MMLQNQHLSMWRLLVCSFVLSVSIFKLVEGFTPLHHRYHDGQPQKYGLFSHNSKNDMPLRQQQKQQNIMESPCDNARRKRRQFLTATITVFGNLIMSSTSANALPFVGNNDGDRRQLELCIVSILRLKYFAECVKQQLIDTLDDPDENKKVYLEIRLGAKATLTKRVGGGATSRVYTLATLQLRGCLDDLMYYAKKLNKSQRKEAESYKDDIIDALANIVEFDGLETTQDPSPRSSLMLSQYTLSKAIFLKRMLSERLIPTIQSLVDLYGPEVRQVCQTYIQTTFPNEVPKKKIPLPSSDDTDSPSV